MKIIKDTFLNCNKATLLAVKNQENPLGILEMVILKFHLYICTGCKRFAIQSKIIDKFFSQMQNRINNTMSESKKKELQNLINNQI